jgi:hypothetical protein
MEIVKGRTAGRACLLARNDAAQNRKDGLLLHHLGTAYGGNWQKRQATALRNILLMPH